MYMYIGLEDNLIECWYIFIESCSNRGRGKPVSVILVIIVYRCMSSRLFPVIYNFVTWILVLKSFLLTVDGNWGSWGSYGACSVTCASGTKSRSRSCNNPAPAGGGSNCVGSSTSSATCTLSACPSKIIRKYFINLKWFRLNSQRDVHIV